MQEILIKPETIKKGIGDDCPECGTPLGGVGVNDEIAFANFIEEQIIDTNLDPCSKGILDKLKNLKTNDIAKVLDRFGNLTSKYNWEIKTGSPSIAGNAAETNWKLDNLGNSISNSYVTTLRTSYTSTATDLAIARTILHEAIHTYIISYIDDLAGGNTNDFSTEFPDLWNNFVSKIYGVPSTNIKSYQHQEMAENFVNVISDALEEYDNYQQDSVYYNQLAWGALMDTDAFFSALGPNGNMDQAEQEAILITNQQEDTNSSAAKGSPCP